MYVTQNPKKKRHRNDCCNSHSDVLLRMLPFVNCGLIMIAPFGEDCKKQDFSQQSKNSERSGRNDQRNDAARPAVHEKQL